MLFSSIVFLFIFFPVVLILYYAFFFSRACQNVILLLASLIFYAWGEPLYVLLMIASILVNSLLAGMVQKLKGEGSRKVVLWIAVAANLATLFVFKYLGFVMETFGLEPVFLPLPIGISFFTFQAMSYVVDVYRGTVKAENPFYVGLYISFFPQLIAGPIIQYNTIAEQIRHRKSSFNMFSMGISRFTVGLAKKILLSNCFAGMADNIFRWSMIGTERMAVPPCWHGWEVFPILCRFITIFPPIPIWPSDWGFALALSFPRTLTIRTSQNPSPISGNGGISP